MNTRSGNEPHRILGLDVRPHRLGYAGIEPPARLFDFGASRFDSLRAGELRLAFILKSARPQVLVLRRISPRGWRDRPRTRRLQRLARHLARHSSIETALVNEKQLVGYFRTEGARTNYEIASSLARRFPELAYRLPRRRKPWDPQSRRMLIFDALSLAIVYVGFHSDTDVITHLR